MQFRRSHFSTSWTRSLCALSLLAFASGCAISVNQTTAPNTPADASDEASDEARKDPPKGDGKPPKKDPPKKDPPKREPPKKDPPKANPPKNEPPKKDPPKADPPKNEPPKKDPPKADPPKNEPPKNEPPKKDPPKADPPKNEPPKKDPPKVDPKPVEKPPAPPKPVEPRDDRSELVVPIRVPMEVVNARIDALLPKTESKNWFRATKKGASPEIEVKYKVWRDAVKTSFSGRTLRVTVPVRYAANVRAKVKNPLGGDWIWLTQNETWGTSAKPQRLSIIVDLTLTVENDWKVTSVSKLVDIKHGAPPTDDVCVRVGIDVCVEKSALTNRVREEINDAVVPKIEKALTKADSEIEKALDLKKHASALWGSLQQPQLLQKGKQKDCPTSLGALCRDDAWLSAKLDRLGLSQLELDGDDLTVTLGFGGKLKTTFGKKPKVEIEKLPPVSSPSKDAEVVIRTALEIPTDEIDDAVTKQLSGKSFSIGGKQLALGKTSVELAPGSKSLTLLLETTGSPALTLRVTGKLELDEKAGILRLSGLDLSDETRALLKKELPGFDEKALEGKLREALKLEYGKETASLRRAAEKALRGTIPGKLTLRGGLKGVNVRDFSTTSKMIVLGVELFGSVELDYEP